MNFLSTKTISILLAASVMVLGNASASTAVFTDNNSKLVSSISELVDGVTLTIEGYTFAGSNASPSSDNATTTIISAFRRYGIGIGSGGNPEHSANNDYNNRELFLIQFDKSVSLKSASISEWGNTSGTSGGDSDVDYWAGTDTFSFDNLGTRFENDIPSNELSNNQTRTVTFDSSLDNINWLLFGPETYSADNSAQNVHDYIKLRNIEFDIAQSPAPVPLPAPIFLLGSALMALAGFKRKASIS